jgi:hypothetical protein
MTVSRGATRIRQLRSVRSDVAGVHERTIPNGCLRLVVRGKSLLVSQPCNARISSFASRSRLDRVRAMLR